MSLLDDFGEQTKDLKKNLDGDEKITLPLTLTNGKLKELPDVKIKNKTLNLYRGIAVSQNEVQEVIDDIKNNGLYYNGKQFWSASAWKDLRNKAQTLFQKEDLSIDMTKPASKMVDDKNHRYIVYSEGEKGICFADKNGAIYYATRHNKTKEKQVPLLISINVDINDVAIDGNDFLYTAFQKFDVNDTKKALKQIDILKSIYGERIVNYIEKIIKNPNSDRNAVCDLIICDNDIIDNHYNNEIVIGGRCSTLFKSAFYVKTPILPGNVCSVDILSSNETIPDPMVKLNCF